MLRFFFNLCAHRVMDNNFCSAFSGLLHVIFSPLFQGWITKQNAFRIKKMKCQFHWAFHSLKHPTFVFWVFYYVLWGEKNENLRLVFLHLVKPEIMSFYMNWGGRGAYSWLSLAWALYYGKACSLGLFYLPNTSLCIWCYNQPHPTPPRLPFTF